jgi:hypothetical protein
MTKTNKMINCKCLKQKKYTTLTQSDKCICKIGTSMSNSKRSVVKRVNVTMVKEFSAFD